MALLSSLLVVSCAAPAPTPTTGRSTTTLQATSPTASQTTANPSTSGTHSQTTAAHRDGFWTGTISAHLETVSDGGLGNGTVDMQVQAVLEERTFPIEIDGREVGFYTQLFAGGTTVANQSVHTNEVDGTRCTADVEVTLTDAAPSGWIIRKHEDVDITPFIGFDLPVGRAWYNLTFYTADVFRVGPTDCTNVDAEGPYDVVAPTIGFIPIDVEQWDIEMRSLESDNQEMTGSYQRHWVTGDDIDDQTVEWHLIREGD